MLCPSRARNLFAHSRKILNVLYIMYVFLSTNCHPRNNMAVIVWKLQVKSSTGGSISSYNNGLS